MRSRELWPQKKYYELILIVMVIFLVSSCTKEDDIDRMTKAKTWNEFDRAYSAMNSKGIASVEIAIRHIDDYRIWANPVNTPRDFIITYPILVTRKLDMGEINASDIALTWLFHTFHRDIDYLINGYCLSKSKAKQEYAEWYKANKQFIAVELQKDGTMRIDLSRECKIVNMAYEKWVTLSIQEQNVLIAKALNMPLNNWLDLSPDQKKGALIDCADKLFYKEDVERLLKIMPKPTKGSKGLKLIGKDAEDYFFGKH